MRRCRESRPSRHQPDAWPRARRDVGRSGRFVVRCRAGRGGRAAAEALRLGVAERRRREGAAQHEAGRDQEAIEGKADHRHRGRGNGGTGSQRGCGAGTRIVTIWPLIGSKTVMVIVGLQHRTGLVRNPGRSLATSEDPEGSGLRLTPPSVAVSAPCSDVVSPSLSLCAGRGARRATGSGPASGRQDRSTTVRRPPRRQPGLNRSAYCLVKAKALCL